MGAHGHAEAARALSSQVVVEKSGSGYAGLQPACTLEPFQNSSTHDMRNPPAHAHRVSPTAMFVQLGRSERCE